MKKIVFAFLIVSSFFHQRTIANERQDPTCIQLLGSLNPKRMSFISHTGPGPFDNALALNIPYGPIEAMRLPIERVIERPLDYLKIWDPRGEAHVTIITPPEFSNVLSKHLTMKDIESVAIEYKIQSADLIVLGVGSGKKEIDGVIEETFFVVVDSRKIRRIRHEIWKLFVKKGGDPAAWDPTWFFPHITIGYTKQDLHEPDVMKNIKGSWDRRFKLVIQ